MKKNLLGNTGIEVSELCLGTMTWGHQNTEADAHEQLDYAMKETDINFIDTAEIYAIPPRAETQGLTEKYIGTWLQKNKNLRQDIILGTKMTSTGINWIREGKGLVPEKMGEALDASLARLNTDYVDLYQLHWPQRPVNKFGKMNWHESMFTSLSHEEAHMIAILQEFQKLQKAGKARFLGLSNETPWGVMKFLEIARRENLPQIQTVQNVYHLLNRQYEVGLAEISMYENVGLLAYSPLAGGVLTGKYLDGNMPLRSRYESWGHERQGQHFNEKTLEVTQQLKNIASQYGLSVTELSLAWVNSRAFVHTNIIGATTIQQLKEDIESVHTKLPQEIFSDIDALFSQIQNPATF